MRLIESFKKKKLILLNIFLTLYVGINLVGGERGLVSYFEKKKIYQELIQKLKQVFKNKKGKQITIGDKTPQDWVSDVKANLNNKQIKSARKWYSDIYDVFVGNFGAKDGVKYMTSWLLSCLLYTSPSPRD